MSAVDARLNGTSFEVRPERKRSKGRAKPSSSSSKQRRTSIRDKQRLALVVGSVGVSVLALSLWHCTAALSVLTGSPIFLAGLLAIGIDAGMVVAELAHIQADGDARLWAGIYVGTAVALSVGLNGFASVAHAERWLWLAGIVGGMIPLLVYMLFRIAGHLWRD